MSSLTYPLISYMYTNYIDSYLPEPSSMAEFGSLTTWLTGLMTATGGVFFLAGGSTVTLTKASPS